MPDHTNAIKLVLDCLTDTENGVVKSLSEIHAVGHRVVHGGEKFASSVVVDDEVMKAIEECSNLAPLHNPANLLGISVCKELMPGVPQVAVFDTAFHQTMPPKAYLYGLPYEAYTEDKIRRYGFHGTSHSYVSKRVAEILGKKPEDLKTIVCHLGNGSSVCAVDHGKSVDTSMGLTPLAGVLMGTRCGDIDPSILEFYAAKHNLDIYQVTEILNKKSGVLGISGVSSDFRDLEEGAKAGNDRCEKALDTFMYQVAKIIGSYAAAMNGVDNIVFTAGVGENSAETREGICAYLGYLGITVDAEANGIRGKEVEISTADSKVKVFVIPTNEELMIARDTVALTK
jgi:acetate kinase